MDNCVGDRRFVRDKENPGTFANAMEQEPRSWPQEDRRGGRNAMMARFGWVERRARETSTIGVLTRFAAIAMRVRP
jgi:hypothetical protein